MPVLRYFVVAGAGLLALLFVASAWLPASVVTEHDASGLDKTTIRISGDRPAAERVTIDTSVPTITPPAAPVVAQEESKQDELKDDSRREALARMDNSASAENATASAVSAPMPVKKAAHKHRKRPATAAAQPLFALW
ncbi:MAG: hypothetical protein EKK40_06830 [Bradyrhizobiaceae bacterium]|nr:MAG: hypothetical protein EKK40_06830 [Bradyrhizobiaceae bacterium]